LPQEIISKHGKKLLYSGGFENRKNLSRLFRAFYQVTQEYGDLYMIITGNLKNNKKFHRLIHSCGINEKILLPGNITDEQMQTLYQSGITGAVNLSLCEGFGRNSYEALLNGLPLLCSDIEINHEIVGDYPIYCDPTNVEDIINGLKKLMKTTANKSLSSIDERFTIDYNFSNFSNLIDDCMK
jgi:glycosyltransferase involved in cell wall biosynthesis